MSLLVSGGFNQADERFTDESSGKQCAFMSLSALLTAQITPVDQWNSTTVDSVLMQGNGMYLNALYNCHIPREQLLLVDHLPRVVSNFSFKQKTDLSIVAEPIDVQIDIDLPILAKPILAKPIKAQLHNDSPIVAEPVEAQKYNDSPIVVQPIEAQKYNDSPIVAEPVEAQKDNDSSVNEAQIHWIISYGNDCQGLVMDNSPFRQTFELGIFISTAEKSIQNLVKWQSLVAKHCKVRKI